MTIAPQRPKAARPVGGSLVQQFEFGLDAPICLTWELTYACNLECAHCLSSSGRRDPRELTTEQCEAVIDELQRMQVFYVNIGGGEPTIRPDFWHLLQYAVDHQVGVKFSTNGVRLNPERAAFLASPPATATSTCRSPSTVRPPRSTTTCGGPVPSTPRSSPCRTSRMPASPTPRSRWSAPGRTSASSTSSRPWPTSTAPRCDSPGCARPAVVPTCGTSCTRCPSSSVSSTTG